MCTMYLFHLIFAISFGVKLVSCSHGDEGHKDVDSTQVSFLPSFIQHMESEFEVKPHGIPYIATYGADKGKNDREGKESVNPEYHREDINPTTLKRSSLLPSLAEHSFISPRAPLRSDSFDDPKGHRSDRRFFIFGGDDEPAEPSLEELLEDNKTSGGVLLVDFYATWCRPCNKMAHNLEAVKTTYRSDKLRIHKIDVDRNQECAAKYKVAALPTLLLFKRGKEVKRIVGLVEVDKLMEAIDDALSSTD